MDERKKRKGGVWREGDAFHIDVRGLPPPEPMYAIVKLIESPRCGDRVIAHLEREPIFLYPELDERGWRYRIVPGDEDEVRLQIDRGAG